MKPIYPDLYAMATAKVKKRVARWPSAYASGQVVIAYKNLVTQRYGPRAQAYTGSKTPLTQWFDETWVDILSGAPCGSVKSAGYYPVCRPLRKARQLTPAQRLQAIRIKQAAKKKTATYPSYFAK